MAKVDPLVKKVIDKLEGLLPEDGDFGIFLGALDNIIISDCHFTKDNHNRHTKQQPAANNPSLRYLTRTAATL